MLPLIRPGLEVEERPVRPKVDHPGASDFCLLPPRLMDMSADHKPWAFGLDRVQDRAVPQVTTERLIDVALGGE